MDFGKRRVIALGNDKMNRIKESTQALIEKYRSELSQKGLEIVIGKRYFENNVSERWSSTGPGSILNQIDRARDRKKEKKIDTIT